MSDETNLTIRQNRFVEAVVEGADTYAEARRKAGYSQHPATLYPEASRAASSPKLQRAIAIREEERRDSAREIHRVSGRRLLERVNEPNVSDQLLLGARKVAGDEIAAGVSDTAENSITNADRHNVRHEMRLLARRFARVALRRAEQVGVAQALEELQAFEVSERARFPRLAVVATDGPRATFGNRGL